MKTPLLKPIFIINILLLLIFLVSGALPLPAGDMDVREHKLQDDLNTLLSEKAGDMETTKARPLFHANRRPPVAVVAAAPVAPKPKKVEFEYRLAGILGSSSSSRTAYLQNSRTQETVVVKSGDVLGPWKILEVAADSILVVGPDGEKAINLASGG